MTKANELRIGNFIWCNSIANLSTQKTEEGQIKITAGLLMQIENGLGTSLSYIPLTEDWLLKFGFERDTIDYTAWYRFRSTDIVIFIDLNDNECVLGDYDKEELPLAQSIKYVHQLQNLYFALAGQELTIKEPQAV